MGFVLFVFYVAWIVVNIMIASEKHRDITGVVIGSIFLSPLTIYLYLLAVPVKNVEPQKISNKAKKNDDWADD